MKTAIEWLLWLFFHPVGLVAFGFGLLVFLVFVLVAIDTVAEWRRRR